MEEARLAGGFSMGVQSLRSSLVVVLFGRGEPVRCFLGGGEEWRVVVARDWVAPVGAAAVWSVSSSSTSRSSVSCDSCGRGDDAGGKVLLERRGEGVSHLLV